MFLSVLYVISKYQYGSYWLYMYYIHIANLKGFKWIEVPYYGVLHYVNSPGYLRYTPNTIERSR